MSISGAELIIEWLEQHGIELIAGMPGGALLPLYEALGASTRLRHVLVRHEQAAGFIAQGSARLTGRAGVCFVTSGPGVTNVVTALADAKMDSVPMVCIAGQVSTHLIGTDAFQEVATLDLVRPITKAQFFVESAHDIPDMMAQAFYMAEHGRPGPVLIDLPKNVQTQRIERDAFARRWRPPAPPAQSRHNADAYEEAAALIGAARRPLLYLGGGVVKARAQRLAREFAEQVDIPVTTTLMALGLLPREHRLNLGMLGMHGARHTNLAIDAADLLITIGARFDDRATGDPKRFAPNAKIIHIDIDTREFGKIKQPTLAIADDAGTALRELSRRLSLPGNPAARCDWHQQITELKRQYPMRMPRREQLHTPYGIMRALGNALPTDAIVTTDVGQHQMWAAQTLPLSHAERWLTSGGLGTMGFGLPSAIGAALASPNSPVICISGDGSLLINIQELATLAELELNVKVLLLDNAALGLVRQQQELFYQQRFVASRYLKATDFVAIAKAFGVAAYDLKLEQDPERALVRSLYSPGPALIRVHIAETEHVLPMVTPGACNTAPLDHPPEQMPEAAALSP